MKTFGFSMIELLIVVAILVILMLMALFLFPKQLEKARDAQRKNDLQKIKISFEDFFNDNGCYPSVTVLENCGGVSPAVHELSPYLQKIPCDPKDQSYYVYLPHDSSGGAGTCNGFRVWANLEINDDPAIADLHCDSANACGAFFYFQSALGDLASEYNYGVSEGVPVLAGEYGGGDPNLTSGYCCAGVCNAWSLGSGNCVDGPYVDYSTCVAQSMCNN